MAIIRNVVRIFFITTFVIQILKVDSILPPSQRIQAEEAPFVVFIIADTYYCTGVILNERLVDRLCVLKMKKIIYFKNLASSIVLTAAHCASGNTSIEAGRSSILFGRRNVQRIETDKTLIHQQYSKENEVQSFYDICLLLLKTPLTFNQYVQPIEWTNHIDYEKPSTVYGWGATHSVNRSPFLHLRAKNISLIPDDSCIDMLSKAITKCTKQEYEFCAQNGACHGDSGGPLVQKVDNVTKLIGIVSWGADDNLSCDNEPAVYENVGYFSQWINDGIRDLMDENVSATAARVNFTSLAENLVPILKNHTSS